MRTFLSRQRATLLTLALIAMLGILNACTVITTGSQTDAITRPGGWVFDNFSVGTPTATVVNVYKGMTVVFEKSGTVIFTTSAEARATVPNLPSRFTGTWSLSSLEQITLNVPSLFDNSAHNIRELNASTLRFDATQSGMPLEFKWTAK